MGISRIIFTVILLALAGMSTASTYSDDTLTLDIPPGFEGPIEGELGPGAVVVAYNKPYPGESHGTLLQVTTYDFGDKLDGMPANQRAAAAEFYLTQFLKGVERKRTSYSESATTSLLLDSVPTASRRWSGNLEGEPAHGIMYCAVVRPRIVCFHTQDRVNAPPENQREAVRAFETVKFKDGG